MTDLVGKQLGKYRLTSLLGRGGFAEVYRGEHIYLKSQAAIKVLRIIPRDEEVKSFLTEAQELVSLRHPHIVRVLDFDVENGVPFLVMEYAPHGSLRQRYPISTRIPPETIVSYVRQVSDALQYAHNEKLIHRDVKPENMLLGPHDEVLLSDFGIALVAPQTGSQPDTPPLPGGAGLLPGRSSPPVQPKLFLEMARLQHSLLHLLPHS